MKIVGTSYFPSKSHAICYYCDYHYGDVRAAVERKIAEDVIHIGKPGLSA